MTDALLALLMASPWLAALVAGVWRIRNSRDLDNVAGDVPDDAPLVSIIIPARNEAATIDACVRAALATTYRPIEVIVVDDHSTDGTGDRVRAIATDHGSVDVLGAPELPRGWLGKPWACRTGAADAQGEILCFTDADTRHGPELVARSVRAMRERSLDMLSVVGHQELGSFWERAVQPVVFSVLGLRYGGTETINRSPRVRDKIANGQCLFVTRTAYDASGGHAAVHDQVAEDLALAQLLFAEGRRTAMILGRSHLTTRMYTSLAGIVEGWRKNLFVGGQRALPGGSAARSLFPVLLPLPGLLVLLPPLVAVLALAVRGPRWLLFGSTLATLATLGWSLLVCLWMRLAIRYALVFPLGAAVFIAIAVLSIASGDRVRWKGREYRVPAGGA